MRWALLFLAACGSSTALPPTVVATEEACVRAIAALRAARDAGTPCEAAKASVAQAEPLCPLRFVCADAGAE